MNRLLKSTMVAGVGQSKHTADDSLIDGGEDSCKSSD